MYCPAHTVRLLSYLSVTILLSISPQCVSGVVAKPAHAKHNRWSGKRLTEGTKKALPRSKRAPARRPEEERSATPHSAPKAPPLEKPKPLPPVTCPHKDPLAALDALVTKQYADKVLYIPWIQTVGVLLDYSRLAAMVWNRLAVMQEISGRQESRCEGGLTILFRKNIQLSGMLGYNQLSPINIVSNRVEHTVEGSYGRLGLSYLAKYNSRNNLYLGLSYARSHFSINTTGSLDTQQALQVDWWEVVIGSEHQLHEDWGFYAGVTLCVRTNTLHRFPKFAPATNYVVPGYGRRAQCIVPSGTLYIKYQLSFLEKQIQLQ
ncbi:MAG: hypothetical protein AAFP93_01830 [Bacteroidota bacterium]